jgi:cholesterol transport system auxiliary component
MKQLTHHAIILVTTALLAACTPLASRQADRYFVLEVAPSDAGSAVQTASSLRVTPTSASSFYDTQDIVYSRSPGTRGYYQFSHWTDRPQRAIHAQLVARLQASGRAGGQVLGTHLEEIYHDATQPPGTARIVLTAQIVDPAAQSVVARRTFIRTAPATSNDAPGAVRGFDLALGALLDDVVVWASSHASQEAR